MPLIQVHHTPGKTTEQKAALVRELTDAYARALGIESDNIWVMVNEVPADSWSIGGETLAARRAAQS